MIAMMGFYGKVPYGPKGVLTSLLVIGTGTIIAWAGGCDHDLCEPAQTHYASVFNQNRVCMVVFCGESGTYGSGGPIAAT